MKNVPRPRRPDGRVHGDSFDDVTTREDELAGTTSSHGTPLDRQPEEPSDVVVDESERLEGDA